MVGAAGSDDVARFADLQQAESLRRELESERGRLLDAISQRNSLIRNGYSTSRLISELHRAQNDLDFLNGLLHRLNERFSALADEC